MWASGLSDSDVRLARPDSLYHACMWEFSYFSSLSLYTKGVSSNSEPQNRLFSIKCYGQGLFFFLVFLPCFLSIRSGLFKGILRRQGAKKNIAKINYLLFKKPRNPLRNCYSPSSGCKTAQKIVKLNIFLEREFHNKIIALTFKVLSFNYVHQFNMIRPYYRVIETRNPIIPSTMGIITL